MSGSYFHHQREARYNSEDDNEGMHDRPMELSGEMTGMVFPDKKSV